MSGTGVANLRASERWWLVVAISGTFGTAEVTVLNVAEEGALIAHAQPLRIATRARLRFHAGPLVANVAGMVVWSRLSKTPNEAGKYLYHSGMRIETEGNDFATIVAGLAAQRLLRHDADSMQRKQQRILEREQAPKPLLKLVRTDVNIPPDHILLVQHARERLRSKPDEATKWYERACLALPDDVFIQDDDPHREGALAIWEYLERSVPLDTVLRVFEYRA